MGLDAYFYRRTKVTENDVVTDDLLLNAFYSCDKLKAKLNRLSAYAKVHDKFLYECLDEAMVNEPSLKFKVNVTGLLLKYFSFHL